MLESVTGRLVLSSFNLENSQIDIAQRDDTEAVVGCLIYLDVESRRREVDGGNE